MEILWYGLKVALVGMVVVFCGLVILIGCIKALKAIGGRGQETPQPQAEAPIAPMAAAPVPQAAPPAPPPVMPPRTYVPGPRITRKDDAFYAVVTGTIAQVLADEGINPEGGFRIESIKPIYEPTPGPKLTPKDDAFYAVITGAIAKMLESEGINPEGGFVIKSVKPVEV